MVVLGGGRRARRAAGGCTRGARSRRASHHGQRPAGPVHARAASARRPPRRASGERDPGRPLGDRPRERLAAEHRPLAALGLPHPARARARALRRAPSPRADDPVDLPTTLMLSRTPLVATFHASGDLGWMRFGTPVWGFIIDRVDYRIAVSERARVSQQRWLPGDYDVIPNGVLVPDAAPVGDREHRIVFAGRQEPRKGLQVLLRAWPEIRRRPGSGSPSPARTRSPSVCSSRGCACRTQDRRRRLPEPGRPDGHAARRQRHWSRRRSGRRASGWC